MSCRPRDTVQQFQHKSCFTLLRQSDVIFVELMGPNITHLERFVCGVVEHPRSDSYAEGAPGALTRGDSHAAFHTSILDIWVGRDL